MKRAAFTFWELLAVILIVLVVAVLLFPVFAARHRPSQHTSCASNEKQIGLSIVEYAQDNDNHIPDIAAKTDPKSTWRVALAPYSHSNRLYQCPLRNDESHGPDGFPRSYAANYTGDYSGRKNDVGDGAFGGPGSQGVNLNDLETPADLIMLCEVSHHNGPDFNIDNLAAFDPGNTYLYAGHTDGSNYLLCDGHVKWLKPLDTKALWHRDASVALTPAALGMLAAAHGHDGE